jgi:Na+/proline symporter
MATFLAILSFGLVMLIIGHRYKSDASIAEDFNMSMRTVDVLRAALGIFSVVGAGELVIMGQLTMSYGYWSIMLFVGFALGCLALQFYVNRIRSVVKKDYKHLAISIPDYIFLKYGKLGGRLASILLLGALGSLLMVQIAFGMKLLHQFNPSIPEWGYGIAILATVALYVTLDGIRAVLATDVIQVIAMFALFIIITTTDMAIPTGIDAGDWRPTTMSWDVVMGLLIGGFFWTMGGGDIWQRVFASGNSKVVRWSLLINVVLLITFGYILTTLCFKLAPFHINAPDSIFENVGKGLPKQSAAWIATALFASFISTADTELLVVCQIINREFISGRNKELSVKKTRVICLYVSVITLLVAIVLRSEVITSYYFMLYLFTIVGTIAWASLHNRGNAVIATIGAIVAGCFIVFSYFCPATLIGKYVWLFSLLPLLPLFFFKTASKNSN